MKRISEILKSMEDSGLDSLLIMKGANLHYISGFTGTDSYAILSAKNKIFITDSRYTEQAEQECPGFEIVRYRSPLSLEETLAGIVKKLDLHRLGFEKDFMTYDQYEKISQALQEINFIPTAGIVENTRTTKDQNEVGLIKKAAQIGDEAFNSILSRIKVGISEKEIEAELEYQMKRKGAFSTAFPTIVASGPRSSLPHALPTERKLQYGDFVTLDFGASYQNYRSDMTRTIIIGKTDKKQKQIYELVLAAQKQGIQSIKAGILGSEVDRQARTMIAEAGFGDFFGHGLGHGVGLEIHEEPFLNSKSQTILEAGNTITVEPGVYLPHWGGVRIEDTVLVTEDGCQLLTHSPKELITIQ